MRAAKIGYNPDALDAIREVMAHVRDAADALDSQARIPLWKAVQHVADTLGDTDNQTGYPLTLEAIWQAALEERIEIWGKRELPAPQESGFSSEVWTPINPMYWRTHLINSMATGDKWQEYVHTYSEPLTIGERQRYWSLEVRPTDIQTLWPKG